MNKLKCNVGDKFGDWEVLNPNSGIKNGHVYVTCKCKCGAIKDISLTTLIRGKTSKCRSCAARERTVLLKLGSKIKHWTILEGPIYKNHFSYYKVRCDCGREFLKATSEIIAPNDNFQCASCAQKENKEQFMINNGKIGELSLTRYTYLKNSAMKRHLEFSVSIKYLWDLYIKQNKICAITGDTINSFKEASLDRIDSSEGYIEGNVQWVTRQANLSKHVMTMEELYEFCKKVLKHANQQPSAPLKKV